MRTSTVQPGISFTRSEAARAAGRMQLEPYERIDDTAFSLTREELVRRRGAPWRAVRNAVGLNEMDYGDRVYRFQDCGRLEEVTLGARAVSIGNVVVPFARLGDFVRAQDARAFERAGFLVSPRYGLAFDPGEPFWITVLARHCIGEWEALRV